LANKSHIEKKSEMMHSLLWDNILEDFFFVSLASIPIVGKILAFPGVRPLVEHLVEKYITERLFEILTRWAVFTSIDWGNSQVYNAYENEAEKLIDLQDKDEWSKEDEKRFKDAARKLIRFNLRS